MRFLGCVLAGLALLLTGCETTSNKDASDQPPRVIFYKTKAARVATPAWGNPTGQRRDVKLVYDDEVKCYAVDGRDRHYYDRDHNRFLRYWDDMWQTSPDYSERADWEPAPAEYVPGPLQKRYENVPPGNPSSSKRKKG